MGKKERFSSKIEMYVRGSKGHFGLLIERMREKTRDMGKLVFTNIIKTFASVLFHSFFPLIPSVLF